MHRDEPCGEQRRVPRINSEVGDNILVMIQRNDGGLRPCIPQLSLQKKQTDVGRQQTLGQNHVGHKRVYLDCAAIVASCNHSACKVLHRIDGLPENNEISVRCREGERMTRTGQGRTCAHSGSATRFLR